MILRPRYYSDSPERLNFSMFALYDSFDNRSTNHTVFIENSQVHKGKGISDSFHRRRQAVLGYRCTGYEGRKKKKNLGKKPGKLKSIIEE
ncbi:MAG: hypothetical protein QUS12_02480 [Methanosarcina sp.]|nr:hypothetical protein [Methanosarcina sp.]